MHKVKLNEIITGKGKEPIKDKDGKDLLLKEALLLALIQPNPNPSGTSPEEAVKFRKLFDKIDEAQDEIELKSEEMVRLKEVVAKRLSELVSGKIILLLEPEN